MCVICKNKKNMNYLKSLTTIFCDDCPTLTVIPKIMVKLNLIKCSNCPNLTSIPGTLVNLQVLTCNNCPMLTCISPTFVNIQLLHCDMCPMLTTIPDTLINLQQLSCCKCSNLTVIFGITGSSTISRLYCSGCPRLTCISTAIRLSILEIQNCPMLTIIPFNYNRKLNSDGCTWLYVNISYTHNIKKLRIIQKLYKARRVLKYMDTKHILITDILNYVLKPYLL
jgi:hypothetical protein